MNKRYVIIIGLVVIAFILGGLAIFFYLNDSNEGSGEMKVLQNKTLSKEHCDNDFCVKDLKIVESLDTGMFIFSGTVENKSSDEVSPKVEFIFDFGSDKKTYEMQFDKFSGFGKDFFEYQTTEKKLMNTKDFVLRVS